MIAPFLGVQRRGKSKFLQARETSLGLRSEERGFYEDPEWDASGFSDARNSFVPVWISLPPFILLEYFVELSLPRMPVALVFPTGFLLFWAFYFTFYKPNVLEERLSNPEQWKFSFPPSLISGFALWFLQASFLELRYLLLQSFSRFARKRIAAPERDPFQERLASERLRRLKQEAIPHPGEKLKSKFPPEIQAALSTLGFEVGSCPAWMDIHKRYRALAKKLHPDLNDTGTQGRRFIEVDQAYRKLARQKELFS